MNPAATGDSFAYSESCVKVDLAWEFDSGRAPAYDYQQTGLDSFYNAAVSVDVSGSRQPYLPFGNIARQYRYSVSVQPFAEQYAPFANGRYTVSEVNTINNDSFCVVKSSGVGLVSYRCSGFTAKNMLLGY